MLAVNLLEKKKISNVISMDSETGKITNMRGYIMREETGRRHQTWSTPSMTQKSTWLARGWMHDKGWAHVCHSLVPVGLHVCMQSSRPHNLFCSSVPYCVLLTPSHVFFRWSLGMQVAGFFFFLPYPNQNQNQNSFIVLQTETFHCHSSQRMVIR